jgi:hypothetical protein
MIPAKNPSAKNRIAKLGSPVCASRHLPSVVQALKEQVDYRLLTL